ncbi:MAG: hypothetical protein ACREVJ_06220, partial [Gammaproteobacteria bacterium]
KRSPMPRPKRACRASPAVSSVWPPRPRERRTDEEIVAYLDAALEEGEATLSWWRSATSRGRGA